LDALLAEGRLYRPFYHRIEGAAIVIPALRERPEDIPPLLDYFNAIEAARLGRPPLRFSNEAVAALLAYPWPGNVRELKKRVGRIFTQGIAAEVGLKDLGLPEGGGTPRKQTARRVKLETTLEALKKAEGNVEKAAAILHVNRSTVWRRLRRPQ
jgi:DNA-binding NtrC family response regulator